MTPERDDDLLVQEADLVMAMRDELAGVRMRCPAELLIATGRGRQARRWLSGLTTTLAALATGLGLAVTGQAAAQVHVTTVGWSVNTNPNGTITVTTRNVSDPARLQQVLARAGVPAVVRYGEICTTRQRLYLPLHIKNISHRAHRTGAPLEYTFSPAGIPPGAQLLISEGLPERARPASGAPFVIVLADDNWRIRCEPAKPPYPSAFPRGWWHIPVVSDSGRS